MAAASGALAAKGKPVDLFGVVVLALVTAVGGGTIRDVVLDVRPVFWVADSSFVVTAVLCAFAVFVAARYHPLPERTLILADAAALALFTVVGVEKTLAAGASPIVAVAMGAVTGAAGGMIRDVLAGEIPLVLRPQTHLYATASLCGAAVFVLLRPYLDPGSLRLVAAGTTLALRLWAIWWKIGLPEFRARDFRGGEPGVSSSTKESE